MQKVALCTSLLDFGAKKKEPGHHWLPTPTTLSRVFGVLGKEKGQRNILLHWPSSKAANTSLWIKLGLFPEFSP